MAISRAQLVKELLPGLNALFGLEYARYDQEHEQIFETESSDRAFEEEVMLTGFDTAPVKSEGAGVAFDQGIPTKRLLWLSALQKKLSRIIFMTNCQQDTLERLPEVCRTPSKSKVQRY